ncbi:hypothetical protein RB195_001255 [Necator americanus]|uniref:Uncharacterized protein n=1 Tax=Necator americanus TaxID=51031 RepID=A0ABR1DDE2_NECAM
MDGLGRHDKLGKSPLLIRLKAVGSDVNFFTRFSRINFGNEIANYDLVEALSYEAETWADTAAMSMKVFTTRRALERCILKFNRRTQHLPGPRSSDLRAMSRLRDPTEHISKAKHK